MIDSLSFPFTDETRASVKKEWEKLGQANTVLKNDLQQVGVLDFSSEMIDTYFAAMVEIGLIEKDHLDAIRLTWEQRLNTHLTKLTGEVKAEIERRQRLAMLGGPGAVKNVQKKSGLIIPGS